MSNGIIHDRFTKQISIPASLLVGVSVYSIVGIIGSLLAIIFCFIGTQFQRIMTPDLDVDDGDYSFYLVRKVSPFLSKLWQLYWKPYALIVPHRNYVSHSIIISTAIRFIYVFWPLIFIWEWILLEWDVILYIFIGMCIADAGHISLDYILWFRKIYENHKT